MSAELRPYQVAAIDGLRRSLGSGKRRPMLAAPTGAGKTRVASAIVNGALAKGRRVVFTVPALALVDQTIEAFWDEGIRDVGVIQASHHLTDWSRPVQVASVQTLMRRPLPKADLVMVDEAHKWFDLYGRWMGDQDWAKVPFVGLSATPWTRGLGKHYDDLVIAATTADLIRQGYLSPFRVFAPSHPDLSGVRTVAGDYHEGDLSDAMDRGTLTADIVGTWLQLGGGEPTLCFAVDRAHARKLETEFAAAGVPTAYIDGETPDDERRTIRKAFHAGSVKVVCSVGVLTTGVDWDVRCIVLARPTKSEILFTQIIGRGLRTAEGKQQLTILDHSDSHLRLGFVTDIRHDELDDGKRRTDQPKQRENKPPVPKACPSCSYVKPPRVHVCPNCGFKPERVSDIEVEDGVLTEFTSGKAKASMVTKQRWYSMLLHVGRERGYRPGWAANQYRQKFQVWPKGLDDVPLVPDMEVASWVKSRQIAYAKRKQKDGKAELVTLAAQATERAA